MVQAHRPKLVKHAMSTRCCLEIDPEIWHTYSMNPCESLAERGFLLHFFDNYVRYFLGYLGIRRSKITGETSKKSIRQRLARNSQNTCANHQDLRVAPKTARTCSADNIFKACLATRYLPSTVFQYGIHFVWA